MAEAQGEAGMLDEAAASNLPADSDDSDSDIDPHTLTILKLKQLLNKSLRVEMTDGRILIGIFLCTDRDANIILGSCSEYLPGEVEDRAVAPANQESRMLGLIMVPGRHIVDIWVDRYALDEEYRKAHPEHRPL